MPSSVNTVWVLAMTAAILVGKAAGAEPPASHQAVVESDQIRAAAKPRVVQGEGFARQLGEVTGLEEKPVANALKEASEHIRVPGQSCWVKVGGQTLKFVGKASGPAGMVIGVAAYATDAAEIEQKLERGELTREEANAEQAKLLKGIVRVEAEKDAAYAGLLAGAAIGTFVCPGPGTVVGGVVGAVGGYIGADLMMAATGVTDALDEYLVPGVEAVRKACSVIDEYLVPGVEAVRKACSVIKEKGIEVTVAARDRLRDWVGPEAYDQTVAALDTATTWAGDKVKQAGTAVKEKAVYVKDKTVEGATQVSDAASAGASWTKKQAESGWEYLRRKIE